jgi:hypothetical protein
VYIHIFGTLCRSWGWEVGIGSGPCPLAGFSISGNFRFN